jgi:hypothetical protein
MLIARLPKKPTAAAVSHASSIHEGQEIAAKFMPRPASPFP